MPIAGEGAEVAERVGERRPGDQIVLDDQDAERIADHCQPRDDRSDGRAGNAEAEAEDQQRDRGSMMTPP